MQLIAIAAASLVVRMRVLQADQPGSTGGSGTYWQLANHTADDVLERVRKIKPQMLERFISGRINLSMPVPVSSSHAPMSAREFLDECAATGAEITPRISLWEYDQGTFFETLDHLFNLQLQKPLRTIGLDNWGDFWQSHKRRTVIDTLNRIKAMGWTHVATNEVGGFDDPAPNVIDSAEAGSHLNQSTQPAQFEPSWSKLRQMASAGIQYRYVYIDFPGQVEKFKALPIDQQASNLQKLMSAQWQKGANPSGVSYEFVLPLLQGHCGPLGCTTIWDSTTMFTTDDGPFHGASLYDVMVYAKGDVNYN